MIKNKYLLLGLGIGNSAIKRYFDQNNIDYDIYNEELSCSNEYNTLIKSSGIIPDNNVIKEFKSNKKLVLSDLGLYSKICNNVYNIGVTGSNGKTTTSKLINDIISIKFKTSLCGNIGNPIFDNINNNIHVIECSSYMLDDCYKFKPNIFVLLNIKPHHLDYHKTFINYIKAKIKCLKNITEECILIYNYDDKIIRKIVENYSCKKLSFSHNNKNTNIYLEDDIIYLNNNEYIKLKIKNIALYDDYMAAILVGKVLEINDNLIKKVLVNFKSIEHRYEIFYQSDNLIVINDSKATNPEATLKAFESTFTQFSEFQALWIGGGKICNENFSILEDNSKKFSQIILYGENRNHLYEKLNLEKFNCLLFPNIDDVIKYISTIKINKLLILFSPSSPSFDQFKNFEERGNIFKELIKKNVIK